MTLLDSQPPKAPSKTPKYVVLIAVAVTALGAVLYILFRNYREERAVERFLVTLQQGRYEEAYRLWQPSPSYTFQDFQRDWGEQGDYGRVREFEILSSRSKGSNTVMVRVRINQVDPPLELLVDRKTKGLSYSIF